MLAAYCPILSPDLTTSIFFSNGTTIKDVIYNCHYDLIILDLPSQPEPFKLLRWIKSDLPYTPVIVTSRIEPADIVVKTIKEGASDFIAKPYSSDRVSHAVSQAIEERSLKNEIDYLRRNQDVIYDFEKVVAKSVAMKEVIKTLKKFAQTDATIMMTGETGTGKVSCPEVSTLTVDVPNGLLLKSIAPISRKPYWKVNCSVMKKGPLPERIVFVSEDLNRPTAEPFFWTKLEKSACRSRPNSFEYWRTRLLSGSVETGPSMWMCASLSPPTGTLMSSLKPVNFVKTFTIASTSFLWDCRLCGKEKIA